jgi:cellobiose-specific phosphotransferase system component IIA
MAMGLLKGAMQGVRDSQRETARRGLYEAEAKMRQARQERTSLEAELDQEQRASS